jgi:urease accessory protein
LEGYSHQASLIFVDEKAGVVELVAEINELLALEEKITFGVSALPVNGIVIRILGNRGEQLFNCLQSTCNLITAKAPVLKS